MLWETRKGGEGTGCTRCPCDTERLQSNLQSDVDLCSPDRQGAGTGTTAAVPSITGAAAALTSRLVSAAACPHRRAPPSAAALLSLYADSFVNTSL